jgi:prephenate dehydrogenase
MRVAMLGFGLIGGSIAQALRVRAGGEDTLDGDSVWSVAAWSPTGGGPSAARAAGVIDLDASTPEAALAGADIVILAGPAPTCRDQLDALAGPWRTSLDPRAVITDVASTKVAIVERAATLGLPFVGGHPMAGRESSGYANAAADLFVDRPWVMVPSSDETVTERVEALARATGARPERMTAAAHDSAVAAISHLPLVLAAALVEAVAGPTRSEAPDDWPTASRLAAGGWRDMTRLARGDVAMGSGILATNGPVIASRVADVIAVLERWKVDLDVVDRGPDGDALADRLAAVRERLESMP